MHVVVLDPGMVGRGGHHLAINRFLFCQAKKEGHRPVILTSNFFSPAKEDGFLGFPTFAYSPYTLQEHFIDTIKRFIVYNEETRTALMRRLPSKRLPKGSVFVIHTAFGCMFHGFLEYLLLLHRDDLHIRIVLRFPPSGVQAGKKLADEMWFATLQQWDKCPHDLLSKKEMNQAPFPWYDELHALRYWDGCPHGQVPPHAHVWSSRGCPYKCIFCVWPATMTGNDPDGLSRRTVRHYTPEYMEAFLTELVSKYNYQSIYFDDDTFNLGNRHVVKMCEVMQKINLPWSAMCRADTIKMETWKLMKDSGCFGVKLGFESGNQRVVNQIVNKHLDLEYSKGVVHHLKEIGMTVHGTFTYGLPGETKEDMMDTKSFIASLPFDSIQESGTAEIEGTPLSTLSEKGHLEAYEGAIIDESYQRDSNGSKKWQKLSSELQER